MRKRFKSEWWSVELPDCWEVKEDEVCVSLHYTKGDEIVQVSAARKETGAISKKEVLEFSDESRQKALERQLEFTTDDN